MDTCSDKLKILAYEYEMAKLDLDYTNKQCVIGNPIALAVFPYIKDEFNNKRLKLKFFLEKNPKCHIPK